MALQRTNIGDIVAVGTSATTLVETDGTTKKLVMCVAFHNYSASSVSVQLHVPPPSSGAPGAVSDATQMFEQTLVPNETWEWAPPGGWLLTTDGQSLRAVAGSASAINATVHGDAIT